MIAKLLGAADAKGMDVWLGLLFEEGYNTDVALVEELWAKYGGHTSLKGFYYPPEYNDASDQTSIINTLGPLAEYIHSHTGKKFALSPYITNGADATAWKNMWINILASVDLDYLLIQDSIGAFDRSIADALTYLAATKQATDTTNSKSVVTHLWADVETFVIISDDPFMAIPMSTAEWIDHMLQESADVENIVTFSYDHYQSPKFVSSTYHQEYKNYYNSVSDGSNLALNKPYSASTGAHASYPDSGGTELTNGIFGTASFAATAWQGRVGISSYNFTIDLGTPQSIGRFESTFFKRRQCRCGSSDLCCYQIWTNGSSFTTVGTVSTPGSSNPSSIAYRLDSAATGRYVRVIVNTAPSWSFIDEVRVLAAAPGVTLSVSPTSVAAAAKQ